jgi:glycolate oxidase iron-sulfur subunit
MSKGFAALDPCVHCGFCLPACPTFLATGDEADSPRGRIVLMRALERNEISPRDESLREHLDACLGCRGCEPVCPSGVEYGRGLETAREILAQANGLGFKGRALLAMFRRRWLWKPFFALARLVRNTGLPRRLAGDSNAGFSLGMLSASTPAFSRSISQSVNPSIPQSLNPSISQSRVLLFRGCVMSGLFDHVHRATRRTLEANGYQVIERDLPHCCGALHLHAGDRGSAVALARSNLASLTGAFDYVVVNSAGCGAMLKDYGHLLGSESAQGFASRVRDVTELLAQAGPRAGAPIEMEIAYDAPCHLQHAQKVHREVLALFAAIPGLTVTLLPGYDRCCGSAGIFSMLEPEMSRWVLEGKITGIADAPVPPSLVATGNPGCLMQIGAGLKARRMAIPVAHPVELLDLSYQRAGYYG